MSDQNPWAGTIEWLKTLLANAFGRGTPMEGMEASAILFAVTFASNFVGQVWTIVFDVLFAILFVYNLIRYTIARWGSR
ncbi:hypothetical protein [Halobiforma nitratireducens]|uniref:Uncharacterized protein n=1 Tax=Halobiforma nitratireducens JCM 10879 TaxID=1227454 RepID=M0MHM8_9EURY|nr:hypothetical protein [Halobiforma nitratireducens]EMA45237.1 hypothetical protein C446_02487 [Halobiforma nitratireducens JCM 10879]